MDELQRQFDFYVAHQDELVAKYRDRWIVIAKQQVVGDFDTEMAAYEAALSKYPAGTFMIQLVQPGEENYTQTFHSRVAV